MDFVIPSDSSLGLQNELMSILYLVLYDGDDEVLTPLSPDVSLRHVDFGDKHNIAVEVVAPNESIVEQWTLDARKVGGEDGISVLSDTMKKRIVTLKRALFALICSHRRITIGTQGATREELGLYSYRVVDGAVAPLNLACETHTLSTTPPSEVVISVTVTFLVEIGHSPRSMCNIPSSLHLPLSPFEECVVLSEGGEESHIALLMEHRFFERSSTSVRSLPDSSTILAVNRRRRKNVIARRVAALVSFLDDM
jgi:hypothetical protein